MNTKTCPGCGKQFERQDKSQNATANAMWQSRVCCSRSCASTWQHRKKREARIIETKICAQCGIEFANDTQYRGQSWDKVTYCSNACRGKAFRKPRALCMCGCGKLTKRIKPNYLPRHDPALYRNHKTIRFEWGRYFIRDRHGKRTLWSRVVLADKIGRLLEPHEIAHHINGDKSDDRPENLELIANQGEHLKLHRAQGDLYSIDRARKGLRKGE